MGLLGDQEVPPPFSFSPTPSNFLWQNTKNICVDCTLLPYSLSKTGQFSADYSFALWKKANIKWEINFLLGITQGYILGESYSMYQ